MQFYKAKSYNRPISAFTLIVSVLIMLNVVATLWMVSKYRTSIEDIVLPKAYVSLANNDNYAKGIVALSESLKQAQSNYPLVAMVTQDVSLEMRKLLVDVGCVVKEVQELDLPDELSLETKRWGPAFTKLIAWTFEGYSKLVFLDSDLLVLQNIDELFQLGDRLHATLDTDASSCRYKPERLKLINSGVLVIKPQKKMFDSFMSTLFDKEILAKGPMNDQDVINHVIPYWKPLSYPKYGAQVTHCECEDDKRMWDSKEVKMVHFTAGLNRKLPKPWDYDVKRDSEGVSQCLQDIFVSWHNLYEAALRRVTVQRMVHS